MMEWQPIETAPDGVDVLVCRAETEDRSVACRFGIEWFGLCGGNWVISPNSNSEVMRLAPTHWMPLPEPPL